MTLGAAFDVERALDRKEPPLVVERPHLGLVEEGAAGLVGDDRTIVPGVPQPAHDVHEFGGDLVAQVVLVQALAAKIERRGIMGAGHDVPRCPAAAEMVERREAAGNMERLAETRGHGRTEPDVARRHAQRRQQRHRLEAIDERRVISRVHRQPIGDEEQVELATLGDPRNLQHHRQAAAGRRRAFVAPAGRMVSGAEHEYAEMHLTFGRRHAASSRRLPAQSGARSADHWSTRMFFSRTMFAHLRISVWTLAARMSGGPPTPSMPSFAKLSFTLDKASTALVFRFTRSTADLGVPAGANSPNQTMVSNPGSPDSEIVGCSGSTGERCGAATPKSRMVPALA